MILHSSVPEISSGLRTFCRAVAGRFRKSLKIKIEGNTAGELEIHRMGRGNLELRDIFSKFSKKV
jgi:hypothetical protein